MASKQKFRVGPAVVCINAMDPKLLETVVNLSSDALASEIDEQAAAKHVRLELTSRFPAEQFQVRTQPLWNYRQNRRAFSE